MGIVILQIQYFFCAVCPEYNPKVSDILKVFSYVNSCSLSHGWIYASLNTSLM